MKWSKLLRAAVRSIGRNKMRSLLTMLGIVIGVGSVVALVALGQGAQADIEGEIAGMGTNLIMVMPGSSESGGLRGGAGSRETLVPGDVDRLEESAAHLARVSPVVSTRDQVIAGGANWNTSVMGVSSGYPAIRSWEMADGTFFDDRDVKTRAKVAVVGRTVADELFPGDASSVGRRLQIRNVPFTIIGVLAEKGQTGMGNDQDDVVLAPWSSVLYRLADGEHLSMIMASATAEEDLEEAQEEIRLLLRDEHDLAAAEADDFSIRTQSDIMSMASSVTGTLTLLLSAVAGVSLVVGGIGIMNIMLVSVTERTREVGIRLAVGAHKADVLAQFLIEAVVLSLIGGLLGLALGAGGSSLLAAIMNVDSVLQIPIMLEALLFSMAVGVFFGWYPARKAATLNPIEALRHE